MSELHVSLRGLPLPRRMRALPVDVRGFPVPWFVMWVDGAPDHRVVDFEKVVRALQEKRCFTCGDHLGRNLTFCLGMVSLITTVSAEPPSHLECIEYALKGCPFLSRPYAKRRVDGLPEGTADVQGFMDHHPQVMTAYTTRSYEAHQGNPGILFTIGPMGSITWWTEGRRATHDECQAALHLACDKLVDVENQAALMQGVQRVLPWFPAA